MSQAMNDLRGSLVALVTPMTASGAIDWAALDGLVDWHLACDMQAETVARLSAVDSIVGIKEACGDPSRVAEIKALVPDDFVLLSGEDAQTLTMAGYGAVGAISVTANVLPAAMAEFCQAFIDDDDKACALDAKLQPIHEALFMETSPIPTKWALNAMGRIDVGIRLPLVELTEPVQAELRRRLEILGAL